jgi:hypothetical protein
MPVSVTNECIPFQDLWSEIAAGHVVFPLQFCEWSDRTEGIKDTKDVSATRSGTVYTVTSDVSTALGCVCLPADYFPQQ